MRGSHLGLGVVASVSLAVVMGCASPAEGWRDAEGDAPAGLVGFLLLEGVYGSELVAPHDVFHHVAFHADPGPAVITIGRTNEPVRSFEGLRLTPDAALDEVDHLDVLVVPSGEFSMTRDADDAELIAWVRRIAKDARWVLSVCDGAFILAEAGVLEGRRCTTYPGDQVELARRYPALRIQPEVEYVVDEACVTGVGGALSYAPALWVVDAWFGTACARGVARGLVLPWPAEPARVRAAD